MWTALACCLCRSLISDDLRKGLIDKAEHTFQLALTLAVSCGMVIMLLMEVAAEQLIAGTGADPTLVPLAASYMRIRALAQPAVLVTMASQGGLLAQRVSCCARFQGSSLTLE